MMYDLNGNIINGKKLNGLHTKVNFDTVPIEKQKPESLNSGFYRDSWRESSKMNCDNLILSDSPNFYNRKGESMSEIPDTENLSPKILHEEMFYDRVTEEIKKPESLNSGFFRGSASEPTKVTPDSLILVDPPNFYNRKGESMSKNKIPYYFETPVPKYFRIRGFFKDPKNCAFVTWAFERCSNTKKIIQYDNQLIELSAYQFIFGRKVCSQETGLTEDEVRTQQKRWEKLCFLKKSPNKTPKRFTVYEWSMSHFFKEDPQQNPQQTPNKPPTNPHNIDLDNLESKDHLLNDGIEKDEDDDLFKFFEDKIEKSELQKAKVSLKEKFKDQPQRIKDAIAKISEPNFKPKDSWSKALYAACNGSWKPTEISETQKKDLRRKNRELFDGLNAEIAGDIVTMENGEEFDLSEENEDLQRKLHVHFMGLIPNRID